jgi:predicted ATP-grasp superfamily ATP-dependent carboligase
MGKSSEITGTYLRIPESLANELGDYTVLVGFSGFGNVGYLALTHIVETVDLESIAFWGHSSWYHRGNIESLLTVYRHKGAKVIIIVPRVPIHVSTVSQRFWDELTEEILAWNCKRYIIVGGLREETRAYGNTDWAAYVPSPKWTDLYHTERTFGDHLAMIGPLSSFLIIGTALRMPVLGLLAYCNFEEDPEASLFALREIENLCKLTIPHKESLHRFDYSFIPGSSIPENITSIDEESIDELDDDDDDDMPGYDLSDLV